MFKATSFIFNGESSKDYGVRICYFGNDDTVSNSLWHNEIVEDRIPLRQDPIFYGVSTNQSMSYSLTFGSDKPLTHLDAERIATWLTSHNTYKWLEFEQPDLQGLRYKAIIQNLETIHVNGEPVAFTCEVVTDSQFAYEKPKTFIYNLDGIGVIKNTSSHYGYYYPKMTITLDASCDSFSITNNSDNGRTFRISGIPASSTPLVITVDNKNQIITCNRNDLNLYKYFGDAKGKPHFFRLVQGDNDLSFSGSGTLSVVCEFPRKVGL